MATASAPSGPTTGNPVGLNEKMLFWAGFVAILATGVGFSVRTDILANWGQDFGFTQTELGQVTGMGLAGFGLSIIFFSFFTDLLGYGKLMVVAFILHLLAVVTTLAAPLAYQSGGKAGAYWCLFIGQFLFSLGNGTTEAVVNPLTATIFPRNKTHYLNILHAGWPGGLVLGALVCIGLNQVGGVGWVVKWAVVLAPVVIYGVMMLGRRFPVSEAKASGVPLGQMATTLLAPVLLFLFLMHALVGYVELGTDSWIVNIGKTVLQNSNYALLAFVWTNVLMFSLRFFAGPIVEKISPVGLLFVSALFGVLGLWLLGQPFTDSIAMWMVAVTVYALGKTFYWPTLLGVISERFPKGGALALGMSGGIGMLAAGFLGGPGIGYKQDYFASHKLQETSQASYDRYKADQEGSFPIPGVMPKATGLDNAKVGALLGDPGENNGNGKKLATDIQNVTSKGGKLEDYPGLTALDAWWKSTGEPNAEADAGPIGQAQLYGGKQALTYTALVPAALAVGFLLLFLYFRMRGGYKQVHLDSHGGNAEMATPQ